MVQFDSDVGVIKELLDRFNHQRFPRTLDIKIRVEAGETLQQSDIDFLTVVINDAHDFGWLVEKHPEYKQVMANITHFYHQVILTAFENETNTQNRNSQNQHIQNRISHD